MPHYKTPENQLYWLDDVDVADWFSTLPEGCVEITDAEAQAIRLSEAAVPDAAMVRAEGARRLSLIGAPYSSEERETWPQQVAEAQSVTSDANAATPLLSLLAASDGVSVASYASLVLTKAAMFSAAAGAVLAAQRALISMSPIPKDYADAKYWP